VRPLKNRFAAREPFFSDYAPLSKVVTADAKYTL
jgi:hypothetical protein